MSYFPESSVLKSGNLTSFDYISLNISKGSVKLFPNGSAPQSISYKRMPNDHKSTEKLYPSTETIYGAI